MKKHLLFLSITGVLICSCANNSDIVMLYDDNVAQMELEEICSDIQIVPVKSSQPMKGISNCLSFGGFDFFLSTDGRTIY